MRLCDPLRVLWLTPSRIQIGVDSRIAIHCDDLTPAEQRLTSHMSTEMTLQEFHSSASRYSISRERADEILNMLRRAGMLTDSPNPVLPGDFSPSTRKLWLERLDPLAVEVALHLSSRIHAFVANDKGSVGLKDHHLLASSRSSHRISAFRGALHMRGYGSKVFTGSAKNADIAFITSLQEPDPLRCADILRILPVYTLAYVEDLDIRVGPTVVRGMGSACASCLFHHRVDKNPAWVDLALQTYSFRHYNPSRPGILTAAGLATGEIFGIMCGKKPALLGKQWVIPPPPQAPFLVDVPQHPSCSCAFLPEKYPERLDRAK